VKTVGLALAVLFTVFVSGTSNAADNAPAAKKDKVVKAEDNTGLVRTALDELYNNAGGSISLQYFDLTYTDNNRPSNSPIGLDGLKQSVTDLRIAMPDLNYRIEDIFASDDKVVVRGELTGSNMGPYNGRIPTLKPVTIGFIEIYRVKGGKIVERWGVRDDSQISTNANTDGFAKTGLLAPLPPAAGSASPAVAPIGSVTKSGTAQYQTKKPANDSLKVKKQKVKKVGSSGSGKTSPEGTNP